MEKRFVLRGFGVGALGGLLAFVFARLMTEPVIQNAIDYENGRDAVMDTLRRAAGLAPDPADPDIYSRSIQQSIGIGVGLILFGLAMGGIFAVIYALAYKRYGTAVRPRTLAVLVAGAAFLGLYLVPYLKYPANPPSIGHPDTIGTRGLLYVVMVAISVILLVTAVVTASRLTPRFGAWNATLLSAGGFVVVVAIVMAILPTVGSLHSNIVQFGHFDTETPQPLRNARGVIVYPGFPADTLFKFRLYSILNQLIMWGTIGLAFGPLAERMLAKSPADAKSAALSPTYTS